MFNLLITGSKGFIGKNLLNKIKDDKNINILEFNRNNTTNELVKLILKSDFIFHLAGEVRPNSSSEDFKKSNVSLTKAILNILEQQHKVVPILLASSIHAKLLKNEYGKTKRESELLIEEYSKKNNNSLVYRLPHVFGEGCKANYNSVISTWIHNSINNLKINVFDRDIKMNYVYVQDIIDEFLEVIYSRHASDFYIIPKQIYETTLGEVVDFINEFSLNIKNKEYEVNENTFKGKLFATYQDYYRQVNEAK